MNSHDIQFVAGHAIPGILLSTIALWWLINIFKEHFTSLAQGRSTVLRPYFLGPCCQFPLESVLKLTMAIGEIVNEVCLKVKYGDMLRTNDAQHLAMYVTIGLLGLVELLRHFRFDSMPEGTERATFLLWIATLTISLAFHEIPDAPLRNLIHRLLVYVNFAIAGATLVELRHRNSVICALGRSYLMLVQGTWFCQLAVYNADTGLWDQHDHMHRMYFVLLFLWHLIANFVLTFVLGGVVKILGRDVAVSVERKSSRNGIAYAPVSCSDEDLEQNLKWVPT